MVLKVKSTCASEHHVNKYFVVRNSTAALKTNKSVLSADSPQDHQWKECYCNTLLAIKRSRD